MPMKKKCKGCFQLFFCCILKKYMLEWRWNILSLEEWIMADVITTIIAGIIALGTMLAFFADMRKSANEHRSMQDNRTTEHNGLSKEHGGLSKEHGGLSEEHKRLSAEHSVLKENYKSISEKQNDIAETVRFLRDAELIRRGKADGISARTIDFNRTVDELKSMAERLIILEKENYELRSENSRLKDEIQRHHCNAVSSADEEEM